MAYQEIIVTINLSSCLQLFIGDLILVNLLFTSSLNFSKTLTLLLFEINKKASKNSRHAMGVDSVEVRENPRIF